MEISESSGCVLIYNRRIYIIQIIVNISFGLEDDFILKRILNSYEYRQPFVVRNMLMFRDGYSSGFLEDCLIVPMRIEFGKNVSYPVVFAQKNNLQKS